MNCYCCMMSWRRNCQHATSRQCMFEQVLQSIGEISAGSKSFKEAKVAVQQSIDSLQSDSSSNPELWVKLARCALGCGCLSQAIIAARTALGDSTSSPPTLAHVANHPSKRALFFLFLWASIELPRAGGGRCCHGGPSLCRHLLAAVR